jgi:perosamine synthetase
VRMKSAHILAEAVADYNWIKPQEIYDNSTHSYWAFPVTIERKDVSWGDFSNKFREFGGKGIYAAWKLNYKEPMFQNLNLLGREHFISAENRLKYLQDLCPNAENLQPKILAFRTNEWHDKAARSQQKSLIETLRFFQNKRMET